MQYAGGNKCFFIYEITTIPDESSSGMMKWYFRNSGSRNDKNIQMNMVAL